MIAFLRKLNKLGPFEDVETKMIGETGQDKWINDVKSLFTTLDFSVKDLDFKVLPSGLFDKKMMMKKLIERQKDELAKKECDCDGCDCLEVIEEQIYGC